MSSSEPDPKKFVPTSSANSERWTTNYGAPVWNNMSSLSVGAGGPILLEDYHFIEKLAQFDRERIPERVVHARGASAKGYFEVTHDITHLTCADLFREIGVRTPIIARFSTVTHERGSPETLRDPRGFAVKFYTREGNWDLVGNNMPVFFIRDGMQFPDMVHAFKPSPVTHMQEWSRIWDFFSFHPESCHMLTWLLDDVGVPLDYRHMPGFGVNTFKLINADGKDVLVKFHWLPSCGIENLIEGEIEKVQGQDHSHATRDLYESIERGDFPEWTLYIQTIDPEEASTYEFDPLDVTKTWPEDKFPLQEVGKMVLNKNPENFFTENEQLAFCPAVVVPGIYYSNDKLLQTRLFAYSDTQRHRLGANYLLLPVNAPRNLYHNNHYDGEMNPTQRTEDINYFPSHFDAARNAETYPIPSEVVSGKRKKTVIEKENNFFQAGERYRSWDEARKERFITRVADRLNHPKCSNEVKKIWIGYWEKCEKEIKERLLKLVDVKM